MGGDKREKVLLVGWGRMCGILQLQNGMKVPRPF